MINNMFCHSDHRKFDYESSISPSDLAAPPKKLGVLFFGAQESEIGLKSTTSFFQHLMSHNKLTSE